MTAPVDVRPMPYSVDIQVRFRDLDPMSHVNNALYVTYLEQARAEFYADVVGEPLGEIDTVLKHVEVSYERAIEEDDDVRVDLTVGDLGRSSVPMEYEIRSDDALYATASTVQVFFDPDTQESTPIPDRYRDRLRR
jgi:acyl-CoA thioester hydrolase